MKDMKDRKGVYSTIRIMGLGSLIPFVLAAGPLGGYLLGTYVVGRFAWPQYISHIFVVIGFLGSMTETYKIIKAMQRTEKK